MSLFEIQKNFSDLLSHIESDMKSGNSKNLTGGIGNDQHVRSIRHNAEQLLGELFFKSRVYIGEAKFCLYLEQFIGEREACLTDFCSLGKNFLQWLKESHFNDAGQDAHIVMSLFETELYLHSVYSEQENPENIFLSRLNFNDVIDGCYVRSNRVFLIRSKVALEHFFSQKGGEELYLNAEEKCYVVYSKPSSVEEYISVMNVDENRFDILKRLDQPISLPQLFCFGCSEKDIEDMLWLCSLGLVCIQGKNIS